MKPMLAKKYAPRKISYPCFVQPKLNGVRGIYLGDGKIQSRSYGRTEEKLWEHCIVHQFLDQLESFPYFFDGEFYSHGLSLQQINSRIGVVRQSPHPESHKISFNIFDIISDKPQHERIQLLEHLEGQFKFPVSIVPTYYCTSSAFAEQAYRSFLAEGFEGMILRDYSAPYGREYNCPNKENRWNCLLKRKEWLDFDCEIIGVKPSTEFLAIREPHIASLELRAPNGKTFFSSSLKHEQKIRYYSDPPIGRLAKIRYEVLSDGGVPLKPQVELVYDD